MSAGITLQNVNGGTLSLQYAGTSVGARTVDIPERSFTLGELDRVLSMPANDISLADGKVFLKTITGVTTFTISNIRPLPDANVFLLQLTNAGSAAITWFSGVKWAKGIAPVLTAAGTDVLSFYSPDGGTTWRGSVFSGDNK